MQFRACLLGILGAVLALVVPNEAEAAAPVAAFEAFDLPTDWQERFWASAAAKTLLSLEGKALADLVPTQAGLRFCRCPNCEATETDDPLSWDPAKPRLLTCRRCGKSVPEEAASGDKAKADAKPEAKSDGKGAEEMIEVLPHVIHHYAYQSVAAELQRYPDERLYLDAKRDYEARELLSKAALYAAVRYHRQPAAAKDPRLARLACVLLVRFAQVYPAYATHYDQPGRPKLFQPANLPPPYRRRYQTAKWDWSGSQNVPLNLVIAYALLRNEPALAEAGRLLNEPNPARAIERDFFLASAQFVRDQPEEYNEMSLQAYRGLLAVGQLLGDRGLIDEARARFAGFAERGFYHDGFWRQGDVVAHRRVLGMIDGWINRLLVGGALDPGGYARLDPPVVNLARTADALILADPKMPEVQQAAWPAPMARSFSRRPTLLGGVGVARLAVGQGADALDIELHGQDSLATPHCQRLAIRMAVGGRPVLDDLDELPPTPNGWDRATASHNTVVVDGLNQREALGRALEPTPGGRFRFFAADPDFQVVTLEDSHAYPQSTTRYRQTVLACSRGGTNYAVGVFEIHGGLQHDQIFHSPAGAPARWQTSVPLAASTENLLPPSIVYLPDAKADGGRWFVQSYGEFAPIGRARLIQPAQATLNLGDRRGIRLHILGDMPVTLMTAVTPDPITGANRPARDGQGRAAMLIRRRSDDGGTLKSTFVTVFEPDRAVDGIRRIARVPSHADAVVLLVEASQGREYLIVNSNPGTEQTIKLPDGRTIRTDGLAIRVADAELTLAGGTFAESANRLVRQREASGRITGAVRFATATSRGWFECGEQLADGALLKGRTMLVIHGDGTTRGWTIDRVENTAQGARVHVVEEPGFLIEPASQEARYYQFPRTNAPGPHTFRIAKIAR